jgi:ubiquinone biosynthesis protein
MQIFKVRETYQDLKRYSHVASVLVRYGFGEILDRLRSEYHLPGRRKQAGQESDRFRHLSTPERVRLAFQELGPTFVKLAQILSTRADLLPPPFIRELSRLQDRAAPFPFLEARALIEADLGRPVAEAFMTIEERPVAAASLAQVHRGRAPTGERVAIKVQRPDIRSLIETDIRILYELANLAERRLPESRYYQPVRLVREFARTIRRELDFVREGRSIDRFTRYFADDPTVHIPKVYWELTGPRILTTEYIQGIKVSDLPELQAAGLDRKAVAVNGANFTLKEIFEYRFFHADPHPGNLFVLENNVIAPVDFGMTGAISEEMAEHMLSIVSSVLNKDMNSVVKVLRSTGWVHEFVEINSFTLELEDFMERYYGLPLDKLDVGTVVEEGMSIVRRYNLRIPADLMLTARALLVSEGVGRVLDPGFNIMEHARPHMRKLMRRRYDPGRFLRDIYEAAGENASLFRKLPSDISQLLSKIMRGELAIRFTHGGIEGFIRQMERSTNRLSFSIVIAALIIGSSLIFQSGLGPALFGYPLLGLIGFLIASILGVWLLIGILRSGTL